MRMEVAVVKMVEAARDKGTAPEKLAKLFDLALEKVASESPVGQQALKMLQTNLLKNVLRNELNVVVRVAKGPRKARTVKVAAKKGTIKGLEALDPSGGSGTVAKKPRGRKRSEATEQK